MKHFWLVIVFLLIEIGPAAAGADQDVMPPALPGWQAGEVKVTESNENLLGMQMTRRVLVREYSAANDAGGIAIMIDSFDCPGASIIDTLHKDAGFRSQNQEQMRPLVIKERLAMEKNGKDGKRDMISVKVDSCVVVSVCGPNPPVGAIDAYIKSLDFDKIKKAAR